jgi:hypothetical protein
MGSLLRAFKRYMQQSMGNCFSLDFHFRGFSEPRNPRNLEPHDNKLIHSRQSRNR